MPAYIMVDVPVESMGMKEFPSGAIYCKSVDLIEINYNPKPLATLRYFESGDFVTIFTETAIYPIDVLKNGLEVKSYYVVEGTDLPKYYRKGVLKIIPIPDKVIEKIMRLAPIVINAEEKGDEESEDAARVTIRKAIEPYIVEFNGVIRPYLYYTPKENVDLNEEIEYFRMTGKAKAGRFLTLKLVTALSPSSLSY